MTRSHHLGLRVVSLLLCLACLLPVCSVGAEPAEEVTEAVIANTTYTCAVRCGASRSSSIIGRMIDGTAVTILGERGDFYKVDCYDMTGYIAKSQIVHKEDTSYIQCDSTSTESALLEYTSHADALQTRHSLFSLAKRQLGYPYVRGGSRPGGFDCSGLTSYLYKQHGVSLNRTASGQLSNGVVVSREGMQVGDLVFFRDRGSSALATHVALYVGNNQIIHAGSKGICYAELTGPYFDGCFLAVRRVINTGTAELQQLPTARTGAGIMSVNSITGRTAN